MESGPREALDRDWERVVPFYQFPREHWKHLRTTSVVESPFAGVRLPTDAAKRYRRLASATAVIWKILLVAQSRFRRLDAPELLADVYHGVTYVAMDFEPRREKGGSPPDPFYTPLDMSSIKDQRMRMRLAHLVLSGWLAGLTISCKGASERLSQSALPQRVLPAETTTYRLVLVDNAPPPERPWNPVPGGCVQGMYSAWYRLSADRWESVDSLQTICSPDSVSRIRIFSNAGTIRRRGDTLAFHSFDSQRRVDVLMDRGVLHGDTLRTGGVLFDGPPLVFVRQ